MIGTWPPIPGISAYCYELAHAVGKVVDLDFLGFSSLYPDWLYPGGAVPRDDSFPPADTSIVHVRLPLAWWNPLGWIYVGLATKADVFHVQFWSLPVAPLLWTVLFFCWLRGIPRVITLHNPDDHEGSLLYKIARPPVLRLASALVVHTQKIPSWLKRFADRHHIPIRVIPHGPLNLYRADSPTMKEDDSPTILFFGAIRPYKGLDVLLESFATLSKENSSCRLIVAGRPWESWDPYQHFIDQNGLSDKVELHLGYIPTNEVAKFLMRARVVALPYKEFSAQSGVALAALAAGKPIVVSNVGGLEELPIPPAWIVPAGDVTPLTIALGQILSQSESDLRSAVDAVREQLSWPAIALKHLDLYTSLVQADFRSEKRAGG